MLSSGGIFALYSLLCRHAKLSLLPNQQAADEELSAYKSDPSTDSSPFKTIFEKHKRLRTVLLLLVLSTAAALVIGNGVLSPAISGRVFETLVFFLFFYYYFILFYFGTETINPSFFLPVLSSMSGLQATEKKWTDGNIILISSTTCLITSSALFFSCVLFWSLKGFLFNQPLQANFCFLPVSY